MTVDGLVEDLRTQAAGNPRMARTRLEALLDEAPVYLGELIERFSSPREYRLRQIVAQAVLGNRTRIDRVPQLAAWAATETDEFTRRSLQYALEAAEQPASRRRAGTGTTRTDDMAFLEAYRYASSRLTHRVRNALLDPQTAASRLKLSIATGDLAAASLHVAELARGLDKVGRIAEVRDIDPEHFALRRVALADWIAGMNRTYAERYEPVDLVVEGHAIGAWVTASDYLLTTIFWNLWSNAQQSVAGGAPCRIRTKFSVDASRVAVRLVDNGPGFSPDLDGVAFSVEFSTKGRYRGRGLLEVREAVDQLRGTAQLVQDAEDGLRIELSFPFARPL